MDQIRKYVDNPLFLKWVYDSDNNIDEYWNYYLLKNPTEKQILVTLKDDLKLFKIKTYKLNHEQKTRLLQKIETRIKREKHPHFVSIFVSQIFKYAAVFVIAIAISSIFFYLTENWAHSDSSVESYTTAIAENGQISKLILPDSSIVWLNSGTQIKYSTDFAKTTREIFLDGQAFFQVKKSSQMPFRVFCKDIEVRVLGTRFNVSSYPEEKDVKVVLETGKIELLKPALKEFKYTLDPGQKLVYKSSSGIVNIWKVELDSYVRWKDGVLIFREDPMSEVMPVLQRKYNIDLEMNIQNLDSYLFTATLTDETLAEAMKSIAFTCQADYKIIRNANKKTKVILTKR